MEEGCDGLRYWEDLEEGARLDCRPFMLTLPEIVEFARQYDPQFFHIDALAAAESRFGGIIASSLQTLSCCTRVLVDAQGKLAVLSGLSMERVLLPNPVRPEDQLSIDARWAGLRRSRSKPDRGIATIRFKVSNQRKEVVLESGFTYLIACRDCREYHHPR